MRGEGFLFCNNFSFGERIHCVRPAGPGFRQPAECGGRTLADALWCVKRDQLSERDLAEQRGAPPSRTSSGEAPCPPPADLATSPSPILWLCPSLATLPGDHCPRLALPSSTPPASSLTLVMTNGFIFLCQPRGSEAVSASGPQNSLRPSKSTFRRCRDISGDSAVIDW